MKKYLNLIAMAVATLGIGYYAYLEFETSQTDTLPEGVVRFYSDLDTSRVTQLKVTNYETNQVTLLELEDGLWQLTSPLKDKASYNEVADYIVGLTNKDLSTLDLEGLKIDNKKFGFADPKFEVEISYKGKKGLPNSKKLVFSKLKTYDNKWFVKTNHNEKKALYLAEDSVFTFINKDHNHFRNKELFPQLEEDITAVSFDYSSKKKDFQLTMENMDWLVSSLKNVKISQNHVDLFLSEFKHLKMDSVYKSDFKKEDLKAVGLSKPRLKLNFKWKNGNDWWMKISKEENGVHHVTVKDNFTIYRITNKKLEKVLVEADHFRNKSYPFNFNISEVDFITIKRSSMEYPEKYALKEVWKDYEESPHKNVDSGKVVTFVKDLTHLTVDVFKSKPSVKLNNSVLLESKKEVKKIFKLQWSDSVKIDDKDYVYVTTTLEPKTFLVLQSKLTDLFKESFFSKVESPKDEKKDSGAEKKGK